MPILPCVFYTFNWLTLTSEMYFVRFHPEVTSCLLSRGKTKYATLGMRLWCKYIRNYLLVYQLTSHFLPYLRNYKEFEGKISDLQLEKYGLSFETKKYTTSGWARGDENVIGIRAFKQKKKKTPEISLKTCDFQVCALLHLRKCSSCLQLLLSQVVDINQNHFPSHLSRTHPRLPIMHYFTLINFAVYMFFFGFFFFFLVFFFFDFLFYLGVHSSVIICSPMKPRAKMYRTVWL